MMGRSRHGIGRVAISPVTSAGDVPAPGEDDLGRVGLEGDPQPLGGVRDRPAPGIDILQRGDRAVVDREQAIGRRERREACQGLRQAGGRAVGRGNRGWRDGKRRGGAKRADQSPEWIHRLVDPLERGDGVDRRLGRFSDVPLDVHDMGSDREVGEDQSAGMDSPSTKWLFWALEFPLIQSTGLIGVAATPPFWAWSRLPAAAPWARAPSRQRTQRAHSRPPRRLGVVRMVFMVGCRSTAGILWGGRVGFSRTSSVCPSPRPINKPGFGSSLCRRDRPGSLKAPPAYGRNRPVPLGGFTRPSSVGARIRGSGFPGGARFRPVVRGIANAGRPRRVWKSRRASSWTRISAIGGSLDWVWPGNR